MNYLKFMERARTEFMRSLGFGKADIFSLDLMFVVRDLSVTYKKPAQLDDELEATARVIEQRGAVIVFEQGIRRHGEVLAEGEVTIACVSREGKPRRLPPEIKAALQHVQQQDP